ncbi:MAG: DUF2254 domain-containing protein [Acidimicrobiales bacterium]
MVRLRQVLDQVRHRLLFVPALFTLGAVALAQVMLQLDAALGDEDLPRTLQTTVDSGRAILSAIAGGLIASITLLLSLTMVAVQLASSQFSPRTVRNWIGDRTQQRSIGVVLGTTVYCLLVLRETRSLSEGDALTPHFSVILAVILGIVSLIAVVRSVDHLTDKLRVGSIATKLSNETIELIHRSNESAAESVGDTPVPLTKEDLAPPTDAFAIEARQMGWIQQIDTGSLLRSAPKGSTIYLPASVGEFVPANAPLAWISPPPDDEDRCVAMREHFALGDTRTMQSDVGFGVLQMVDIALRALSPGVNDPNTANDIVVHLGAVLLSLWESPLAADVTELDGRRLIQRRFVHEDHLDAALDPIRHHGVDEPLVAITLLRTLRLLESETLRRGLPGPIEPLRAMAGRIIAESSVTLADNTLPS